MRYYMVHSENKLPTMDIIAPEMGVEIKVSNDEKTIWVNVDDTCVLHIGQIPRLELDIQHKLLKKE